MLAIKTVYPWAMNKLCIWHTMGILGHMGGVFPRVPSRRCSASSRPWRTRKRRRRDAFVSGTCVLLEMGHFLRLRGLKMVLREYSPPQVCTQSGLPSRLVSSLDWALACVDPPLLLPCRRALRHFCLSQLFLQLKADILDMLAPEDHTYEYMNENIFGEG